MRKVKLNSTQSNRLIELQSRPKSRGKSTTKSKRALLLLVLLATALLFAGCTDHLDITGLPVMCTDQNGKDVATRVVMTISQAGPGQLQGDTKIVNSKGIAEFMIGAESQGKSLLVPGHRPANSLQKVIYTADPISIELRFKDKCKFTTKTKTLVLDDLPQQKKNGRMTFNLAYADF